MTIEINETVPNETELVYLLEYIAKLIDRGFTRGYAPNWTIDFEDHQNGSD